MIIDNLSIAAMITVVAIAVFVLSTKSDTKHTKR